MRNKFPEEIDELLPQTQCGLCGYNGCMPYAEAIAFSNAPINLCPPGGVKTLHALGELLHEDPTPHIAEMEAKEKPKMVAIIREAECIGCTKCIQACPVDAIIGSSKLMHTIISAACTGCELCIPPCPVNCIDMLNIHDDDSAEKSKQARVRFNNRNERLLHEKKIADSKKEKISLSARKNYIQEAIARNKSKKRA